MVSHETLCRISDFDGVYTEAIGDEYEQVWGRIFSQRLGMPFTDLWPLVEFARLQVLAHPESYGWEDDGKIVAPATDRFIVMNCVVPIVMSVLRDMPNHPLRWDTINIYTLTEDLYQTCYQAGQAKFKAGAREFIEEQHRTGKFVIVTNSKMDSVSRKLEKLMGPDNGIIVIGDALKNKIAANSPSITISGLARPVYWDRPFYSEILRALVQDTKEGVVIGDVTELDLIPALSMGLNGVLVKSKDTQPWEIDYIDSHPHGKSVNTLEEAAAHIRSLT